MKNSIKKISMQLIYILFAFLYLNTIESQTKSIYKIQTKLNLKDAMGIGFTNSSTDYFGIATQTSSTSARATIAMTTFESVEFSYDDQSGLNNNFSDKILLYKSSTIGSNKNISYNQDSYREVFFKFLNPTLGRQGWFAVKGNKTNSVKYVKDMIKLAYAKISEKDQNLLNWFFINADPTIDVELQLTLENGMRLSDVLEVVLPGLPTLYPKDFIEKEKYHPNHYCSTAVAGDPVCEELNRVRKIADLNRIDFILEAHRGFWGQKDGYNENTMGSFIAAKEAGFNLMEFDLLPVETPGRGAYSDELSAYPNDMATFHEFQLTRLTSETDENKKIYTENRAYLKQLNVKATRSDNGYNTPPQKIMFLDEIVDYAVANNLIVCLDIKNLFKNPYSNVCDTYFNNPDDPANNQIRVTELCDFHSERPDISHMNNLKFTINKINSIHPDYLKNFVIKSYLTYDYLFNKLTTGINPVSPEVFHKVLWSPRVADDKKWQLDEENYFNETTNPYVSAKLIDYLENWFAHNETVLYYEFNFINDYDKKTSTWLENVYKYMDNTGIKSVNSLEYVYRMAGRRSGIFSQEPSGGKGNVDFWGKWFISNSTIDRRSDHIWLLNTPFFKYGVITTERPEQWRQLNAIQN